MTPMKQNLSNPAMKEHDINDEKNIRNTKRRINNKIKLLPEEKKTKKALVLY